MRTIVLLALLLLALAPAQPAGAAPLLPSRLDLGAARIVVEAPLDGQYLVVCQTTDGPALAGPWALLAGDRAHFPMIHLGVPCWVQVTEYGERLVIHETAKYAVWRVYLGQVRNP